MNQSLLKMPGAGEVTDYVIRCRGLPWSCGEDDMKNFFSGIGQDIVKVCFALNNEGRPSGEAYVEFASYNDYQIALAKDKEKIGKRYIEIFPSKKKEMEYMMTHNRESQGAVMNNSDCIIRLRGLPFGCWEDDIQNFFTGLDIAPNGILLVSDANGRQTGEAFVQFVNVASYEAAVLKHKENIGHRYVEVFRSSYDELERYLFPDYYDYDYPRFQSVGGGRFSRFGAYGGGGGGVGGRLGGSGMGRLDGPLMGGMRGRDQFGSSMGGAGMGMSGRFSPYGGLTGFKRGGYGMGGGIGGLGGGLGGFGGGSGGAGAGRGPVSLMGDVSGGNGGSAGSLMDTGFGLGGGRVVGNKPAEKPLKHYVYMRGLPFKCGTENIVQFFSPLRVAGVQFNFDAMGRPSGEARVEFFTHNDAEDAMKRDHAKIEDRYIELFLSSETKDDEPFIPPSVLNSTQKPATGVQSLMGSTTGTAVSQGSSVWGSNPYTYSDFSSNNF